MNAAQDFLLRHMFAVACSVIVLVLTLCGSLTASVNVEQTAEGSMDVSSIPTAIPRTPTLGSIRTMRKMSGDTRYSIDIIRQVGAPDRVGAQIGPTVVVRRKSHLTVIGWAVDAPNERAAVSLFLTAATRIIASCWIGGSRPDVAKAFNNPAYETSGFECDISPDSLPKGRAPLGIDVITSSGTYYEITTPTALVVQ
jgi:hypothetical protein